MSNRPSPMKTTSVDNLESPAEVLIRAGIAHPRRVVGLIRKTIDTLELDLKGFVILTEAASGPYVVTAVIHLLAGAKKVIGLTAESAYASADAVVTQTRALEQLCSTPCQTEIHTSREFRLFAEADLVTNLGFVRPIDAQAVAFMRPGSTIALMCEAWEYRPEDVDVDACKRRGVTVVATNEDFPALDVFRYSGWLGIKMMFEAGIEIHKGRTLIVGSDRFGTVIFDRLRTAGAEVILTTRLEARQLHGIDVLIVADYSRSDEIIGDHGDLSAGEVAEITPSVTIIQFAGRIDVDGLRKAGLAVTPGEPLPARRMARTLAYLGPRPVIELHAAGLKTGELALRGQLADTGPIHRFAALAQPVLVHPKGVS